MSVWVMGKMTSIESHSKKMTLRLKESGGRKREERVISILAL